MARTPAEFSVSDLERILSERKSQAQELGKRRDQLTKELAKIDLELQGIVGTKRRGPKKGARRGKRPKNERSLREIIFDLLAKSKKGVTLADLEPKVLEAGYKSASKNFSNMIYQCLYNSQGVVQDPETGAYRLEKSQ
jgi:hypothetical protein